MNVKSVSCELGGKTLTIETGKMAKQAQGSVFVSYGDTRVLVTACVSSSPKPGQSFFPLTVEYVEKFYAAGKIPGSFMKREGRPSTEQTLVCRLIDRPIRPLFPEGFLNDVQVVATVMSYDHTADPEVAASIGASAALHISEIPFKGPTAAVRVGRVGGEFVINPTWSQLESESDMDIFVCGTKNAVMMVEGGAREVQEDQVLAAVVHGHNEIKKVTAIIEELRKLTGSKAKMEVAAATLPTDVTATVAKLATDKLNKAMRTKDKAARYELVDEAKAAVLSTMVSDDMKKTKADEAKALEANAGAAFDLLQYNLMREMILTEKSRIDGRNTTTVRPIVVEAGILPRAHGSALFTRGETQVMSAIAIGTNDDEQIVDSIQANTMRKFMLHYNFPPFSVGECGRMGGTGRREIGHGALAERAISAMMPKSDKFPYTVRIVCETLESNGSSSMGSVCSASMALMDAGVPFPKPVAGIAMGLIKEGSRVSVLTDILGDEDHLGDMDFKVAGTKDGITAIQMDIKIEGVDEAIMKTALTQAKEGRLHILGEMANAISAPRATISEHAPTITTIMIPTDRIRDVIGSGGKVIKDIIARTGTKIEITDDGKINIASADKEKTKMAIEIIKGITAEVELNKVYSGTVKKIVDFGAFVSVLPNQEGLLHVSEIAYERVNNVADYLKEGDQLDVKVIEIDKTGRIRLSRKVLLDPPAGGIPPRTNHGGGRTGGGQRPRA
ncbi:MAG: polyribonucleotide nucleotidyltransferase [Xanthomonadaceae bacterium]|nr:polyribonucleotide nucleotidyltransferase [Xanthomonadaceae bacterium]